VRPDRIGERAARLVLSGALITEYSAKDRRYDQPEYEPFWAAAALDIPLSLHHGDAAAGPDPRRRSPNLARRQQPRHQGVLSGIVDVRHDLLRRLRASSAPDLGDPGIAGGNTARVYNFNVAKLTVPA
jgi:hypothetical protein